MKLLLVVLLVLSLSQSSYTRRKSKGVDKKSEKNSGGEIDSMICPSCDRLFCTVRKASKLKCKGGVTTDICGCCPVCAKQIGEPCGGEWNYLGKCDEGLACKASSLLPLPYNVYQQPINTEVPMNGLPEGTCVEIRDLLQRDRSVSVRRTSPRNPPRQQKQCQPKCTPDFCERNPKAICSAIDVVDMKRDCQGPCQHTSCYACSWVNPEPECKACAADDFRCIKRFAKCIKRNYCTRTKFPCKTNIPKSAKIGKFQCMVPKCLGRS